jgi:phospholipase C
VSGPPDESPPQPTRRTALKGGLAAAAALAGCRPSRQVAPPAPTALSGIDHFVVVMLENRSFDHLLGALAFDRDYPGRHAVDGLRGGESNPGLEGRPVFAQRRTSDILAVDLRPGWPLSHRAFNAGRNDGFVRARDPHLGPDVMAYHDRELAPFHYALADRYTVCDRWFASVLGPTWPNRFFLHAGTAGGRRANQPFWFDGPRTVWQALAARGLEARCYQAGLIAWYSMAFLGNGLTGRGALLPCGIERFFRDARQGTLPNFSIIDPDFQINDLHPPRRLVFGEAFLASVVRALEESPQWRRSLLVILYDEHGGFFDHVPPPRAPERHPDFRQLGFRVPALVVGPTVRRGAVVSTVFDHTSVLATLRARFGIESLGPRMDAASDLSSCLDPAAVAAAGTQRFPALELRAAELHQACGWDGGHEEMELALSSASHIDPRSVEDRVGSWLRHAQELDVVRLRG